MSNSLQILCIKDTEGYWTEGEMYPARVVAGGFVQVGDDDDPSGEGWSAAPMEYREDGSIVYQVGGIEGECYSRRPAMTDALTKEMIIDAMCSSIEGFAFLIVDSLEFELKRQLTDAEQQEVSTVVEQLVLTFPEPCPRCGNAVPPPFAEGLVRANLPEMCRAREAA
ncbi:hypothetical protein ABLU74_11550 [Klebsiella sp. GG_Kp161]|uniref:hypothetical protein n=1 Tax=Klebsiella sp. GG_Kp161 TaxID=3153472 RepID=UPI0032B4393D